MIEIIDDSPLRPRSTGWMRRAIYRRAMVCWEGVDDEVFVFSNEMKFVYALELREHEEM